MNGRRIGVTYDHEGCFANIYDGDKRIAGNYEFAKNYGSWLECRDASVAGAKANASKVDALGPKPDPETIQL